MITETSKWFVKGYFWDVADLHFSIYFDLNSNIKCTVSWSREIGKFTALLNIYITNGKFKEVNSEMYNCRVLKHIDCLSGRLPTETWLWRGHYNNNTIPHSLSAKAARQNVIILYIHNFSLQCWPNITKF